MSFIPKNPLSVPEIEHTPCTPQGTRGLFAKKDGWYEVDDNGNVKKIGGNSISQEDRDKLNRLLCYGDANIVPSDASLFEFTVDDTTMTASISANSDDIFGDIVIPYEYVDNEKAYRVTSIKPFAFDFCRRVKSIIVPYGVTEIGVDAFKTCDSLTSINIPSGVNSIVKSAFFGCTSLTDVYFEGTKAQWDEIEIGDYNDYLLNATVHYEYTYVGEQIAKVDAKTKALQYYGDANIVPSDESLFLFSYMDANMTARAGANSTDISGDIVIPYEIYAIGIEAEGIYKVTATRPDGFEDCKNLTGVILPYGITSIKSATFRNCTNLKSITIPKAMKTIEENAFSGCENLKNVYFRGTRENWNDISIGANNEALLNATIYYEWSDVTKDYVDSEIAKVSSGGDGSNGKSAYEIAVEKGFVGTEEEWLESLQGEDGHTPEKGVDYFTPEDIASLNIPVVDGFLDAKSENAVANKAVTEKVNELNGMVQGALNETTYLTTEIVGIREQINQHGHFKGYVFTNAEIQVTEATPNDYAYSAESGTVWLYVEFEGWQDTGEPVPDQITPASDTTPLVNGEASVGTENAYARGDHRHPSDPSKASAAELDALKSNISNLQKDVSANRENVENNDFALKNLKYYGDANIVPSNASLFRFTVLDATAKTASIVSTVQLSGDIVIPYECTIDSETYTVTTIGESAFGGRDGMTSITIPSSVRRILTASFDGCGSTIFRIPSTIETPLSNDVFGVSVFIDIYYEGTEEQWKNLNGVEDDPPYRNIHYECVPATKDYVDEKVDALAYEVQDAITVANEAKDGVQENLVSIIELQTQIGNIDTALAKVDAKAKSLQYYGDANIVPSDASLFEFTVDDTTMTASILAKSTNISGDIVIPYEHEKDGNIYSVTEIGGYAFSYCDNLTNIIIPSTVTFLNVGAFQGCEGLTNITTPQGLIRIGGSALEGCTNLAILTIPVSVKKIENHALNVCPSLKNVYYTGTKAQWDEIEIDDHNDCLLNATIHYEYTDITRDYVDEKIGDIDTVLENIISLQETFIGGDA